MNSRSTRIFVLFGALVVVLAACSGVAIEEDNLAGVDGGTDAPAIDLEGADRALEVELTEFDITASSLDFVPGETVKFVVTNAGAAPHEFRLSNEMRVAMHVGAGHAGHGGEGAEEAEDEVPAAEDVILLLDGGKTGTLLFTFPDNAEDYTLAVCLIPGHYEAGMTTDITYNA